MIPSDYDDSQPYSLSVCKDFAKIMDIEPTNGLVCMTKEEVQAKRSTIVGNPKPEERRQSGQPLFSQPRRNSIGDTIRTQNPTRNSAPSDGGATNYRTNPSAVHQPQQSTPTFQKARPFRIAKTPSPEPPAKKLRFS